MGCSVITKSKAIRKFKTCTQKKASINKKFKKTFFVPCLQKTDLLVVPKFSLKTVELNSYLLLTLLTFKFHTTTVAQDHDM